jgi:dephospho-CoA kinase
MMRVALTGGIATGKSACLRRFGQLGAATLDADVVARAVVAPGTPALERIVRRFGESIVGADGALDRHALGQIVFDDVAARRDLEAIVHPAVYDAVERWFRQLEGQGPPAHSAAVTIGIADIPLLFETSRDADFDAVVVAACRPDQQLARLMTRDGLDEHGARRRIAAQWPIGEKARRATLVIDTSETMDETLAGVDAAWATLQSMAAAAKGPTPGSETPG